MTRYEITAVPNYCSNWGLTEALRELIQNGADEEKKHPSSKFTIKYNSEDEIVRFTNKEGILTIDSLLFGNTDKGEDKETIGEFGEGYKIAAIVLNRLGKELTVKNGLAGEVWKSGFHKSEKWGQRVLCFDVYKDDTLPEELCFEVEGIDEEAYNSIRQLWVGFHNYEDVEKVTTGQGDIILDERFKGLLYVGGIAIQKNPGVKTFGYNFNPGVLPLERDRGVVSDYQIGYTIGSMIGYAVEHNLIDEKLAIECVENNSLESHYVTGRKIRELMWNSFKEKNSDDHSIPVCFNDDYKKVKEAGGNPVFISYYMMNLIRDRADEEYHNLLKSTDYNDKTTKEKIELWIKKYEDEIDEDAIKELEMIIEDLD